MLANSIWKIIIPTYWENCQPIDSFYAYYMQHIDTLQNYLSFDNYPRAFNNTFPALSKESQRHR